MFGLQGFADCDGEGCKAQELLKVGLVPNTLLMFDVKALTPKHWRFELINGELRLFCPACSAKRDEEAKRPKLKVVPS
jgi:hypothetical protein